MACNAENVSIWWRHHVVVYWCITLLLDMVCNSIVFLLEALYLIRTPQNECQVFLLSPIKTAHLITSQIISHHKHPLRLNPLWNVELNYLSIPKRQRCDRWSLWMDKYFHCTLFWACDYLSKLGFKLIHVSKRSPISLLYPFITANRTV